MRCHACQNEIPIAAGQTIGFRETCDHCGADLHACVGCAHHDLSAYNECRESSAERVLDRDRANRCDYFRPLAFRPLAEDVGSGASESAGERERALDALESLFKK